jgi:putative ABC transport system ATP-binding protein
MAASVERRVKKTPPPSLMPTPILPLSAPQPVVRLELVNKIYASGANRVHAVQDVSFQIHAGEMVAIMGASGSGKSTLMNILGCLDRPTSGHYLLDGVDVASLSRDALAAVRSAKLGFVFQSFNLLPRTSAVDNVELPLLYSDTPLPKRERRARALDCLARVGLADRHDHTPAELSGGQQQRVAIARSLVNHPQFLLADEPTGNLDSRTSVEVLALFQKLNAEGLTLVLVTHESDIAQCCRRRIVLRDGRVQVDEPMAVRLDAIREAGRLRLAEPLAA